MKYLRADVTILLAAMIGGMLAWGPSGGQLRAAADLGLGRHSMPWCTEHLGMADDRGGASSEQSIESNAETTENDASMASDSSEASSEADAGMDYEHNHPYYGHEGMGYYDRDMADDSTRDDDAASQTAAEASKRWNNPEASIEDDYTEGKIDDQPQDTASMETSEPAESKTADDSSDEGRWGYEYSYPESRYGYGLQGPGAEEPAAEEENGREPVDSAEDMYDDQAANHEPAEANVSEYQKSPWEEKYGNAEEVSGPTSDPTSADAEERADDASNAEMNAADPYAYDAEQDTPTRGSGVEANNQGPAIDSAWDGGPNEANLDKGDWMPSENNEPVQNQAKPALDLEQFGYLPSHLLIQPDRELLRELRRLADRSPGERQAAFRQYVESLGSEAIEFATQYESATGEEAAMLSDDVASSAALLAVYRLYEQGELTVDEAIDLLRRTLDNLSQEWIDGVNEITAESGFGYPHGVSLEDMTDQASASAPRALWDVVSSWASQRAWQWKSALHDVWTRELRVAGWQALLSSARADVDNYHLD